ncbi:hypothetical protein EWM64_g6692 [Hericium alpestre]|uniref:Anaphase-promoting complex subunit 4 WD40 domain-containing protein n=1 Tax=Hericium alpestre TaxID=135208 RepID=A0A4Y9ZRB5_9AGAM|nr:hypothetical protein EWM64_g6692 [Hericium alpestre]
MATRAQIWRIDPRNGNGTTAYCDISVKNDLLALTNYSDGTELYKVGPSEFLRSLKQAAKRSGKNLALQAVFVHDGRAIACASVKGEVTIYDTDSGESLQVLEHQKGDFLVLVTAHEYPDKKLLATASIDLAARPEPLTVCALSKRLSESVLGSIQDK